LLSACGLAVDGVRLTRLEPLIASLLADGERMIEYIDLDTQPFFIARLAGSKCQESHADP
jgi:hypothetical protein